VARKTAATMVSLGRPAVFLHPTDALHGDLGIVRSRDVALVFSNSGETREVLDLVPHLRGRGGRIIGITGLAESSLAKQSDVVLAYGSVTEACPLGLAPTASTAVMLAIGDALALLTAKQNGLSADGYHACHPAGSLGKALLAVDSIMRTGERCPTVSPDATVVGVLELISKARAGLACVADGQGALLGLFTDGDFRRAWTRERNIADRPVGEFMTRTPTVVVSGTQVRECLALLTARHINCVPVVGDHGQLLGIVDIQDAS
jgi:arabinose-5-phosphate isomerase